MAKSYFRFKQFTVYQDRTSMKVCTDACVLGAYANVATAHRLLDIGTGTGLLALMAAQRTSARVDAVEIDPAAAAQARDNAQASPFASRICVIQQAIQEYDAAPYDVILSNPPFFQNHLLSPDAGKNTALHTQTLSFDELLASVDRLLHANGQFFVLLPVYEAGVLAAKAPAFGLHLQARLQVRHSVQHPFFRSIGTFGRASLPVREEELTIYDEQGQYTAEFRELLRDYYLPF